MKSDKSLYEEPNIEVIRFDTEDVIITSGGDWRDPAEMEEIED